MTYGAHVSINKGLVATLDKVSQMGGNAVQIFASPPRNWNSPKFTAEEMLAFKTAAKERSIGQNFLHGIYLVNLHTDVVETRQKAIDSVISHMEVAHAIDAGGVIIHSHRPNEHFISAIDEILAKSPEGPKLIIEHSAVTTIEQTLSLFAKKNINRLGLCLDTCHLFVAGYNVGDAKVVDSLIHTIDSTIGSGMLQVIHINDAKAVLGSHRDHHENLGDGKIGKDGLKFFVNHPKIKGIPLILETPGLDGKGPDKHNMDILKSL